MLKYFGCCRVYLTALDPWPYLRHTKVRNPQFRNTNNLCNNNQPTMPPSLPKPRLQPSTLQCLKPRHLTQSPQSRTPNLTRPISTYGYTQAKSLVYSQHGNPSDVLSYAPRFHFPPSPSNFRPHPPTPPGLTKFPPTAVSTPPPSHPPTPPSSPSARSPPPSTRQTSTKSKAPTPPSLPSPPPSARRNRPRCRAMKAASKSYPQARAPRA